MPPDESALPPPLPRPRPRIWTALLTPVVAILVAFAFASIVQGLILFADEDFREALKPVIAAAVEAQAPGQAPGPAVKNKKAAMPDFSALSMLAMTRLLDRPYGVAVLVVPGQLAMAAVAFGAAALSRQRMKERLGYVPSALPWWTLPILMIVTIFLGMVGGLLVDRFIPGRHDVLEFFVAMARAGSGWIVVLNTALLGVLPGVIEESLFRGYVQRRLLERWTPLAAVAVSSLLFCAAHFDPVHVAGVVPVGIWLGVIAWRSGAVWPGMLCHATMNAVSFTMMRFDPDPDDHSIPPAMWVALAVGVAAFGLAIYLMRRYPPVRLAAAPTPA